MSEEKENKRVRGPNFSADEKVCLLNIIRKHKHIIENKKTDGVTWRDKEQAWQKITTEFNSASPSLVKRSVQNLRTWFENQKKTTRQVAAKERINFTITGGGKSTATCTDDPIYNLTMSILNKKTVHGLYNKFDGDKTVSSCHESANVQQRDNVIPVENDFEQEEEEISFQVENDDHSFGETEGQTDWGNFKAKNLKSPVHEKLKRHENPRKRTWDSRRRPSLNASTTVARKYEELADLKIAIATHQLNSLKQEEEEKVNKRQQEAEIAELKKTALKLDIRIKETQLRQLNLM